MSESEGESSESSNDFLISPDKIDLNSSYFKEEFSSKPNLKAPRRILESSDSESSDDDVLENFKPEDIDNTQSAELFSQILKNLEKEKDLDSFNEQNTSSQNVSQEESKIESPRKVLDREIKDLLLQGESGAASSSFEHEEEEEEEEEKEEKPETSSSYTIPKEGVQITIPGTEHSLVRQKKKVDLETLLKNKFNQRIRATQILIHKVGLLWWLVYGFHLNRLADDPEILAFCLSLISKNDYPKGRVDLVYVERITKWFNKTFLMDLKQDQILTTESLLDRIRERKIYDYRELVLIFIALLRAIGVNCRLVVSLSPPPLKPKREQLFQTKKEEEELKKESKLEKNKVQKKKSASGRSKKKEKKESEKIIPENSQDGKKNAQIEARKKAAAIFNKGKSEQKTDPGLKNDSKSKKDSSSKSRSRVKTSSESVKSKEDGNETKTIAMKLRKRDTKAPVREPLSSVEIGDEEDSDEFICKMPKKRTSEEKVVQRSRKLKSTEEDVEVEKKKTPQDIWVEVFVESEESWISVSIPNGKIHCVNEIYKKASDPVLYTIAYNSGGTVKDVTRRYCPHWLTVTRKQRVEESWWIESLKPWKERNTVRSKAEDEMLLQRELEQPLPTTVGDCKGHPLYVLIRHLLKFEALYPPEAAPLGYLKNGEAIYSRHCVHTLRSRETWLKFARVVKPAQEAYKVVKSMPKFDKFSGTKVKGLPLDLFGKWQTTAYVPPEAKDGVVPRNEYGNVDLFQMSMLPKGTVHIDLPGLNRVARKLNIDCAPAVIGFNFGGMGAVPAFEGFVVCSEFEDVLREAWETEQIESAKRAREKREKRIYGNWRKLINGLLIKQRLAAKYAVADAAEDDSDENQPVPVVKKQLESKKGKGKTRKEVVEEEVKPVKKARVTKKEEPVEKEQKSKPKKKDDSGKIATIASRLKRNVSKQNYDEEESDAEFEVEEEVKPVKKARVIKKEEPVEKEPKSKPKKKDDSGKTSTIASRLKRNVAKQNFDEEESDAEFEVKKQKVVTRPQKKMKSHE